MKSLFLEGAAHFDEAVVPKEAAQFAKDEGNGIGGKAGLVAKVKAVDGLEQANGADLKQIFGIVAAAAKAADDRPYQTGVLGHQQITAGCISLTGPGE